MTKLEKFLEGVEKLRTPENTKKIDALIEGTNLIAAEYRKRKLREEKARLEAEGFRKLDQHRIDSGLSTKAFIEGVGKTIIESSQPDDIKDKLMENLKLYANYLTESTERHRRPDALGTSQGRTQVRRRGHCKESRRGESCGR